MMNRGALTILAILILAASMASVAVWFQHRTGRQCLEIWGVEGANLIRHAKVVEALRLKPGDDSSTAAETTEPDDANGESAGPVEVLTVGDREVAVLGRVDISQARGLLHARHALIVDHNFDPQQKPPSSAPSWQYALRFQDGSREVILLLDPIHDFVQLYPVDRGQGLRRETMRAEVAFIEREFAEASERTRQSSARGASR